MEHAKKSALSNARERFRVGLAKRGNELRPVVAAFSSDPTARVPRAELQRRLHTLLASAQLFEEVALVELLQRVVNRLDAVGLSGEPWRDSDREALFTLLARLSRRDEPSGVRTHVVAPPPAREESSTATRAVQAPAVPLVVEEPQAPPSSPPERSSWSIEKLTAGQSGVWMVRVLLVCSRPHAVSLRALLDDAPVELLHAADPEQALAILHTSTPACALVAAEFASLPDIDLVRRLQTDPLSRLDGVYLLLPAGAQFDVQFVRQSGADGVLSEPLTLDALAPMLERAVRRPGGQGGLRTLSARPEGTVDEIASYVAEEVRQGIAEGLRAHGDRIQLRDTRELTAAAWSAIGRVRAHLTEQTRGQSERASSPPPMPAAGTQPLPPTAAEQPASDKQRPVRRHDVTPPATFVPPEPTIDLRGRSVLVADDDPAVLWSLSGILREAGAQVLQARDGRSALDLARRERPQVVLSDILMPKIDGFALCRELRRDVLLERVPVILLSWKEDLLERMRELDAGASGYLTKEAGRLKVLSAIAVALAPRQRLHAALAEPEEVSGRVEDAGIVALLEAVAATRPDARVVVHDAWNLFEVELRAGQRVAITRTSVDGAFTRKERALVELLGVTAGRFAVQHSSGGLRGPIEDTLAGALRSAGQHLAALLDAVSDARLVHVARLVFDEEVLALLLRCRPTRLHEVVERFRSEHTSAQQLLLEGVFTPAELEGYLRELARRGAITGVWNEAGADLLAAARAERAAQLDAPPAKRQTDLPPAAASFMELPAEATEPSAFARPPLVAAGLGVEARRAADVARVITLAGEVDVDVDEASFADLEATPPRHRSEVRPVAPVAGLSDDDVKTTPRANVVTRQPPQRTGAGQSAGAFDAAKTAKHIPPARPRGQRRGRSADGSTDSPWEREPTWPGGATAAPWTEADHVEADHRAAEPQPSAAEPGEGAKVDTTPGWAIASLMDAPEHVAPDTVAAAHIVVGDSVLMQPSAAAVVARSVVDGTTLEAGARSVADGTAHDVGAPWPVGFEAPLSTLSTAGLAGMDSVQPMAAASLTEGLTGSPSAPAAEHAAGLADLRPLVADAQARRLAAQSALVDGWVPAPMHDPQLSAADGRAEDVRPLASSGPDSVEPADPWGRSRNAAAQPVVTAPPPGAAAAWVAEHGSLASPETAAKFDADTQLLAGVTHTVDADRGREQPAASTVGESAGERVGLPHIETAQPSAAAGSAPADAATTAPAPFASKARQDFDTPRAAPLEAVETSLGDLPRHHGARDASARPAAQVADSAATDAAASSGGAASTARAADGATADATAARGGLAPAARRVAEGAARGAPAGDGDVDGAVQVAVGDGAAAGGRSADTGARVVDERDEYAPTVSGEVSAGGVLGADSRPMAAEVVERAAAVAGDSSDAVRSVPVAPRARVSTPVFVPTPALGVAALNAAGISAAPAVPGADPAPRVAGVHPADSASSAAQTLPPSAASAAAGSSASAVTPPSQAATSDGAVVTPLAAPAAFGSSGSGAVATPPSQAATPDGAVVTPPAALGRSDSGAVVTPPLQAATPDGAEVTPPAAPGRSDSGAVAGRPSQAATPAAFGRSGSGAVVTPPSQAARPAASGRTDSGSGSGSVVTPPPLAAPAAFGSSGSGAVA
ncbi:MAG: response regulator, partial [Polyangiales bacterium]